MCSIGRSPLSGRPGPRRTAPSWTVRSAAATSAHTSLSRSPAATRSWIVGHDVGDLGGRPPQTGDHDGDLAAGVLLGPGGQLGEGAAPNLLVGLGQLAADRRPAVGSERLGHRREHHRESVRRLEEHHGPAFLAQLREGPGPLPRLAREEALEAEPVDRHTGDGERHEHRARPGDTRHRHPDLDGGADQPVPRIRDGRHPRVGDEDDAVALEEPVHQLTGPRRLVVLVVAQRPAPQLDLEVRGQSAQPAGVLRGEHVGAGQLVAQPRRGVPRVPDGRGREDQACRGWSGRSRPHPLPRALGHTSSQAGGSARPSSATVTTPVSGQDQSLNPPTTRGLGSLMPAPGHRAPVVARLVALVVSLAVVVGYASAPAALAATDAPGSGATEQTVTVPGPRRAGRQCGHPRRHGLRAGVAGAASRRAPRARVRREQGRPRRPGARPGRPGLRRPHLLGPRVRGVRRADPPRRPGLRGRRRPSARRPPRRPTGRPARRRRRPTGGRRRRLLRRRAGPHARRHGQAGGRRRRVDHVERPRRGVLPAARHGRRLPRVPGRPRTDRHARPVQAAAGRRRSSRRRTPAPLGPERAGRPPHRCAAGSTRRSAACSSPRPSRGSRAPSCWPCCTRTARDHS